MRYYFQENTERAKLEDILGKTFTDIYRDDNNGDAMFFVMADGTRYVMHHEQDCCEDVHITDINGELKDLVGSPILEAEEASEHDPGPEGRWNSITWTFYKLATIKGSVNIRWHGESNGYYSESVDFHYLGKVLDK